MNSIKRKRSTLSISEETKRLLDSVKHTGQSYNGLLQELIGLYKKEDEVGGKGDSKR